MNVRKILATALIGTMCLSGVACSKTLPSETTPSSAVVTTTNNVTTDEWYRAVGLDITSIEFTGATIAPTKDGENLPVIPNGQQVRLTIVSPTLTAEIAQNSDVQCITFDENGVAQELKMLNADQYAYSFDNGTLVIAVAENVVQEGQTLAFTFSVVSNDGQTGLLAICIAGDASQVSFKEAVTSGTTTSETTVETTETTVETSETSETSEGETTVETTAETSAE